MDANFDLITKIMLDAALAQNSSISDDGRIPPIPAIAPHDEKRILFAKNYADKIGLPKNGMEFQMLYGIRRDLQEKSDEYTVERRNLKAAGVYMVQFTEGGKNQNYKIIAID